MEFHQLFERRKPSLHFTVGLTKLIDLLVQLLDFAGLPEGKIVR